MSNKSKENETKTPGEDASGIEAPQSTAADLEVVAEDVAEPVLPGTDSPGNRANSPLAWLALFLSVLALAAIAYVFLEDGRTRAAADASSNSVTSLGSRVDASQESLASLDRNIAALAKSDTDLAARLESLQRDIAERLQRLDSLPPRMSGLEGSVASLQGASAGTRVTWILSEAEYYLQIANAQLQLAGNPQLATLALRMADERIVQITDPALIAVRAAIADELAALEVMDKPDIEGVTLTLSSLARVVDSLPLKGREKAAFDNADKVETEEMSGVDRALASVKDAMSGLVRITPPDQAAAPLVTPDAVYFLRTNLTLQLQVARLALLRGETAVFEQSLDDASAWLGQYFDTDSPQVAASLQTIAELRGGHFSVSPPDISKSLRLLRQFSSLTETAP